MPIGVCWAMNYGGVSAVQNRIRIAGRASGA